MSLVCTDERLSLQEVKERVNLPDEDIIRILHSISCGKYRILSKEPNNKTINKADVFTFNAAFTDRMRRIKVRAPSSPLSLPVLLSCCFFESDKCD